MDLEKYSLEETALGSTRLEMRSQFTSPKKYKTSERTNILAMPKTQYHGKDFF